MVTVLVVADEEAPNLTVPRLRQIAPDLVLSAGDLNWDYLEYVAGATDAPLVLVPGNHDPETRQHRSLVAWADWNQPEPRPLGAINADERVVTAAGLRIAGLGGCVRYNRGSHQYTQGQYRRRAARLLRRARRGGPVDVLLTHAPPRGLGDDDDRPHVGIEALHDVLTTLQPTWHLHGHVHPFGRTMPDRQVGPTTIRNVIPWRVLDITPGEADATAVVSTRGR